MRDETSVGAVFFDAFDLFGFGIAPAHLLTLGIEVESVGNSEILVNNHSSMSAVHVCALDFGRFAIPIGPEDVTVHRIQRDSARIRKMRFDEHFSELTVQRCNLSTI